MATLALAAAGAAAGSALLPGGISLLGATLSGAALGSQIGALAGSYVDQALFGASGRARNVEGPRLQSVHLTSSAEGSPIPRAYGRVRLGGQVIWADEITETVLTSTSESGSGKGSGAGSAAKQRTKSVEYRYSASFAVALCEGEIAGIGRVWVDGRELNLASTLHRIHTGSESQAADALISARLGAASAPAFRGTAYIVFQDLALADFGNRIPQLSFEVYRPIESFGDRVRGVVMIPGSGEFVYAPEPVAQTFGIGRSVPENVHTLSGRTDWDVALDQMEEALPNAGAVSLVVSWFGTDLRAGNCEIRPGVERIAKETAPLTWGVAGISRAAAHVISTADGRPAYGGTPSDQSVVAAIGDLKARGHDVILTPFILMDVANANGLPDPYGNAEQAVYPWRGRITCHPAAGQPGTPDKSAVAAAQIAAFTGTAQVSDFAVSGGAVTYSGPNEWSYRRQILHYAHLAKAAGGVSGFLIGTELRGLTQVRQSASDYPFVAALMALAADVKAVLGPGTKVVYGADWSEYFGHHPADGSGDVYFHLDPLWASPDIDAIGIDCYWPLADWRDGESHADFLAGWRSPYDLGYLRANVDSGEGFDWYYASAADRRAQVRTPISDDMGKPWVFRYKDIQSWWSNPHFNRPGGVESGTATAWVPRSKPFWFTEIGCPAIDKGANQPNVFVDPKSSESFVPYFSRGTRDDLAQRRYIEALISAFDPAHPDFAEGRNPVSPVYGGRMVAPGRILVYCWDARPYPAFPNDTDVWGDGANWAFGHWLTGRIAGGALDRTVSAILEDYGFFKYAIEPLGGIVHGYVIDRVMSARDALQPLELAYFFDVAESSGQIAFRPRGQAGAVAHLPESDLVETRANAPLLTLTRGQEADLPASAKITYIDAAQDYQPAVAEARRLAGAAQRVAQAEIAIVLPDSAAQPMAETWLFESFAARERARFVLPPSRLAVEPGDILALERNGGQRLVRITEIADHGAREIEARSYDPDVYLTSPVSARTSPPAVPVAAGQAEAVFLDLPLLTGEEPETAGYVAAIQSPWPGGIAIYSSPEDTGFVLRGVAGASAAMGETRTPLPRGPRGVVDRAARLTVEIGAGSLTSASAVQVFAGRNVAAVRGPSGAWEVFQFLQATLISAGVYELSHLIRGQAGSDADMADLVPAGAPFVLIDERLVQVPLGMGEVGLPLNWRYGPAARSVGDASYVGTTHTFQGLGMRPLSPVHVRATRTGSDVTVRWIRRTRTGGDSWNVVEVPLGEAGEHYEVDILNGSTVVRTLAATVPEVTYPESAQIEDFGAAQSLVAVRVHQMSAVAGRGAGHEAWV